MRAIRAANTGPEMLFRKALYKRGLRFRLHVRSLPGRPDIVIRKYKVVVFVNGCFWHGHRCRFWKVPKTRADFWLAKISNNVSRDVSVHQKLLDAGWRVAIVWECAIKGLTSSQIDSNVDDFVLWLVECRSVGIEIPSIGQIRR